MLAVVLALSIGAQALPLASAADLAGPDKVAHFATSLVITDAAWAAAAALEAPLWGRVVAGVSAGAIVGVTKEFVDLSGCGTPSLGDLAYDALGIGAGVGFALAAEAVLRGVQAVPD